MFVEGERVLYSRFVWASETMETEQVVITKILDDGTFQIQNVQGTIKRIARLNEIKKNPSGPFGEII